jgi:hypothetical protein
MLWFNNRLHYVPCPSHAYRVSLMCRKHNKSGYSIVPHHQRYNSDGNWIMCKYLIMVNQIYPKVLQTTIDLQLQRRNWSDRKTQSTSESVWPRQIIQVWKCQYTSPCSRGLRNDMMCRTQCYKVEMVNISQNVK